MAFTLITDRQKALVEKLGRENPIEDLQLLFDVGHRTAERWAGNKTMMPESVLSRLEEALPLIEAARRRLNEDETPNVFLAIAARKLKTSPIG